MSKTSKIDLFRLLKRTLVANTNEPIAPTSTDETVTRGPADREHAAREPPPAPRKAGPRAPGGPPGTPAPPHRALRPRRRT
jgi:hypothetical protein